MKAYIRVCPVCETENPPDRIHCSCGTLLAGVDFSLPAQVKVEEAPPQTVMPELSPELPLPPSPQAEITAVPVGKADTSAHTVVCSAPDCGQINPAGESRCLYCNRPLAAPASPLVSSIPAPTPTKPDIFEPTLPLPRYGATFASMRRINLPSTLAEKYRIVSELQAAGSEADLLIVEPLEGGEPLVAKIYRRGMRPDAAMMERLTGLGSQVVKLYGYGVSDEVAWELMEYCRAGSLREVLAKGLLTGKFLREMVSQMTSALEEVHRHHILHRDLKPENVLVRQREPLSLALTDFGIASIFEGTRHFTDGARTVKYAAPEALTGVIDAKSDWWSMGMILLEAASGKHPFDGLSEQVVNHHLATRPVEVVGVVDEDLARLCRGLLLRDPSRRWGAAEIVRWQRGDENLAMPTEIVEAATRPYRIGKTEARTREELAIALAYHWQEGSQDLRRGLLREWIKDELGDLNLNRRLLDILEARGESDDRRLLRFLLAAAPQLPPVWQGVPAYRESILTQARNALEGDARAEAWLDSLFQDEILSLFTRQEGESREVSQGLEELDKRWRTALDMARRRWSNAQKIYRQKYRVSDSSDGKDGRVVDFDSAVYGQRAVGDFPPSFEWHPMLVLMLNDKAYREALEDELNQGLVEIAEDSAWFTQLVAERPGDSEEERAAGLVVAYRLLEVARDTAREERERRQLLIRSRKARIGDLRKELLFAARMITEDNGLNRRQRQVIRAALEQFEALTTRITTMDYPDEEFESLLKQILILQRLELSLGTALDRVDRVEALQDIIFQQNRVVVGLMITFVLF
ncbi:MAG: serine/threonine protein kinase, partial [Azovibrio sp.]